LKPELLSNLLLFNFFNIYSVVDAQGLSCSSYIEPTNTFLTFQGDSYANFTTTFSFYLLPDATLEFDASSLSIPLYFDMTTQEAFPIFYTKAIEGGINFIQNFKYEYSFTQTQAMNSINPIFMPEIVYFSSDYQTVDGNASIVIRDISLTARGSIYAIAREIATVIVDPQDEFGTLDVPTRIARMPTNEQINNCLDWNNEAVDSCAKVVIANGDNVELFLKDLTPNTVYIVYYTVANEYPIIPVFSNNIESFTIKVLGAGRLIFSFLSISVCILLMIV